MLHPFLKNISLLRLVSTLAITTHPLFLTHAYTQELGVSHRLIYAKVHTKKCTIQRASRSFNWGAAPEAFCR